MRDEKYRGHTGVTFAVKTTLEDKLEEFPVWINRGLMSMSIPLVRGNYVTLGSMYESTRCSTDDEKIFFLPHFEGHYNK